jgi:hypothetical protein
MYICVGAPLLRLCAADIAIETLGRLLIELAAKSHHRLLSILLKYMSLSLEVLNYNYNYYCMCVRD